ncbi:MAG: SUMF1/EgtB/PvdO family nonheme iron enzyme [Bacteroidetes bacterium]|nr:SUMF1/EgtB/PvdO family nonheme iron enzyme [Bacteroidota bacterium]
MIKSLIIILILFSIIKETETQAQTYPDSLLVLITGGTFLMGETESDYEGPPGTYDDSIHTVTVSNFWMSITEITNQQYVDFLNLAYSANLLVVEVETNPGPDKGKTLVYGSVTAPVEYKSFALLNLDGTRVMKDHDNADGDGDAFTGVIEPENPLNICYIGFDDTRTAGEKFYVKDPTSDFNWVDLTNYYNYTSTTNQLDSTILLNDFNNWPELQNSPNNLPTLENVKNWPATFIRWYGAKAFVLFYNKDLPTEAQWEYAAATGGSQFKYATVDGLVNSDGTSANWNFANEDPALHHVYDVKINNPNPFGLYNIAGNVWEWCEDWYASDFYADATDPVNTTDTGFKVRRGGAWNYHKSTLKSAARAKDEKFKGNDHFGFRIVSNTNITSLDVESNQIPNNFALFQNYPNPFNPSTIIQYAISSEQFVTLKVYDILGKEVATLVNEEKPIGSYQINFDGSKLTSGVYFYRLQAGVFTQTKKFVLLR